MKKRATWLGLTCVMVLALVLTSCRPVTPEDKEVTTVVGKVVEKEAPVVEKEADEKEVVVAAPTGPRYGGTLTVAYKSDVSRGFDPFRMDVYAQHMVGSSVLEGLGIGDWARGPSGTGEWGFGGFLIPDEYITGLLARDWEISSDGTTLTVHLRQGIHFHNKPPANGREVTAADVKYVFDRRNGTGSGFTEKTTWNYQEPMTYLEEITTPDKYTVVFRSSRFHQRFVQQILVGYYNHVYPREVIDTYGNMDDWKHVIGTGPFMMADYVSGSQLLMKKNPDYWRYHPLYPADKMPYFDEYRILIIPDDSTRLAAIRTGKADVTMYNQLSWMEKAQLEKTVPYELHFREVFYGTSVAIKFHMDASPLDDLNVRRALYMGIDFQEIQQIKGGDYRGNDYGSFVNTASGAVYTPFDELPARLQETLTYNPEKAKQMLAGAGYPNGFTLSLLQTAGDQYQDIYEILGEQWRRIGVTLNHERVTSAVKSARDRTGEYQMTTTLPGTAAYGHTTLSYVITGTYKTRYDDPYPVEEWDRLTGIVDEKERDEAIKALNVYLMDNVYLMVPYVLYSRYVVAQPWVRGYSGEFMLRIHDCSSPMMHLWIDQTLKGSLR